MEEEQTRPMLELPPQQQQQQQQQGPATTAPEPKEEGLAGEFAVGCAVPRDWDAPEDADVCEDASALGRRMSRVVCNFFGARRLGHMAVLRWRDDDTAPRRKTSDADDPEASPPPRGGEKKATQLACVVGPFWPFAVLVTYPLILCVSAAVAVTLLPRAHWVVVVAWVAAVVALLTALSCTACRDPGVLRRHRTAKPKWRWNDQARTFRPPGAVYDDDLGLIVEGFDHVCPWTGTGIGKRNMAAFHTFVSLLCVCIIFDILLLLQVLP